MTTLPQLALTLCTLNIQHVDTALTWSIYYRENANIYYTILLASTETTQQNLFFHEDYECTSA